MTSADFRAEHGGDYTAWTDGDFHVYEDLIKAEHAPAPDPTATTPTA